MATTTGTSRSKRTQPTPQRITTFLWFDRNAEEAVNFYVSVFKNSEIRNTTHYGDEGAGPEGSVMTIDFDLDGQRFVALNGGPTFKFTEAISLMVNCETQQEIDYYWEKLSGNGGKEVECGWVKDKFGLSWQIVPNYISEVWEEGDEAKTNRLMKAVMQMKKFDIQELKKAVEGK
ncbi:MAG TPA: VOC family protein [Pyrinomonadaceae bacterium]|nr:VOC family protein [Pyrinomonadaceae bacterium]